MWNNIHDYLRNQLRIKAHRNVEPSAGIVDSQSVATGGHGIGKGFDGGKLVKGRKRHIIVDVMGLLLAVIVHSARTQERKGLKFLLFKIRHRFPQLNLIWADGGYGGQPLQLWMKRWFKRVIEVVKRNQETKGFKVLPRRWVVERTYVCMVWKIPSSK